MEIDIEMCRIERDLEITIRISRGASRRGPFFGFRV